MLPNYLIIGSGRSATTWVHGCLADHPEIYVPEVKELHFFSTYYDRGIEYYKSFFKNATNKNYKAIGEASPSYLADENSAKRIDNILPDVKLIAILRNPIDRAFSQYLAFQRHHKEKTFEEAIHSRPQLLTDGLYYKHIKNYNNYFNKERLLLLLYGDIKKNELAFIQGIYRFLEIDDKYVPAFLEKRSNLVIYPSFQKILYKMHLNLFIEIVKKTYLDKVLRKLATQKKAKSYPKMKSETRKKLVEYYKVPNQRLSELLNRDLSMWK